MRCRINFFTKLILAIALFMGAVLLISSMMDPDYFNEGEPPFKVGARTREKKSDEKNSESLNPVRDLLGTPRPNPTQTFKEGVPGNFEPKIVHKPGPGEDGVAFHLPDSLKEDGQKSIKEFGYNDVASKLIAMERNVLDSRPDECKYWQYAEDLPTASVIVVFHNEGFWTLMRTVHSIRKNSPARFLKEIVLVDDFSDKKDLGQGLETYLTKNFGSLVKLYRNKQREGLIRTRTLGAQYSTGDVIVFLDAHCECNTNWLVPLLARIAYDPTIMAVPIVDGINKETYAYYPVYERGAYYQGIFEWGFLYKERRLPENEVKELWHNSGPYRSPTHAGGLLAMNRAFFFALGGYDPGLEIWGGENFELSFKVWQCGGSIEWVPCSHVGHVYRKRPYDIGNRIDRKIPITAVNYMRVIEVWFDADYREYFYTRQPDMRGYPVGDVSEQVALKNKLQCKNFQFFIDQIGHVLLEKFPPLPRNVAWGEVIFRNGTDNNCWDKGGQDIGGSLIIYSCHRQGGSQMFRFNAKGQIGTGERCVVANGDTLKVVVCPTEPTGDFQYEFGTRLIRHRSSRRCVEGEKFGKELRLRACNPDEMNQRWLIKEVYHWKKNN